MLTNIEDLRIKEWIKEGKVFIYPTDTIYGLGCDATNDEAIERIRKIKGRDTPFSIIAPGKKWIKEHCECGRELDKLPGSFTFLYFSDFIRLANAYSEKLGVRIPDHKISKIVEEVGVPFITTSVNRKGEKPARSIEEVNSEILKEVDIVIDDGRLKDKASTIIDYTKEIPKVLRA